MLFGHDGNDPLGTWDSATVKADDLHLTGRLLVDDVPRAREVRALVQSKAVRGISIGFITKKAVSRVGGGRNITSRSSGSVPRDDPDAPRRAGRQRKIGSRGSEPRRRSQPRCCATLTESLNMKHTSTTAMIASAIELKGEDDDPINVVTKALDDLTKTVDDCIKAIEGKGADKALLDRLDKIETKLARPGVPETKTADEAVEIERRALGSFIRTGSEVELKAASSDNGPDGGWMVLPTVDTSIRSLLTDLSPLSSLAEVVTSAATPMSASTRSASVVPSASLSVTIVPRTPIALS
jgi:hypothetical protein